jgi:glycosyltransferase involved in cell wall biosynthesis
VVDVAELSATLAGSQPRASIGATVPAITVAAPTVSVVVPTKNERENLPRFLASLPADVELVLCDASEDGTPELARALRPNHTIVLAAPGSIAEARQVGAEAASGEVLVFADADIELDAGYFDRLRTLVAPRPPTSSPVRGRGGDGQVYVAGVFRDEHEAVNGLGASAGRPWDAICGPKLSRDTYARYYRLVAQAQRVTYATLGIVGASGSNMVMVRSAFRELGGFRLDLRCNEDTELFLRAGRRGLRVHFDPGLVVWATDHRRLRRGLVRKSAHSLVRNALLYLVCKRPGLPRLLAHDWGYWGPTRTPEPRHASGFDSA